MRANTLDMHSKHAGVCTLSTWCSNGNQQLNKIAKHARQFINKCSN
jgi:hypothetical protein